MIPRNEAEDEPWAAGDATRSATIRDVARLSNVSVTTASVVLRNSGHPVHPDTRARVLEAARRLRYTPNAIARGLVRRRSQILGVRFGWVEPAVITNPYASGVLQGVIDTAAHAGYRVLLYVDLHTEENVADAPEATAAYRDGVSDGVVVIAPVENSPLMPTLARSGVPTVAVAYPADELGISSVDVDNHAGAVLAARHLVGLGHQRIAHIMGNHYLPSVPARRAGFVSVLEKFGITIPDAWTVPAFYDPRSGYAAARRLLQSPERPTAIFAGNDVIALAALDAARDLELRVPEDLSLVGFDDIPMASAIRPALTTVRQPLVEIGATAARLLLNQLDKGADAVEARTHLLMPELIVRGTTAIVPPV